MSEAAFEIFGRGLAKNTSVTELKVKIEDWEEFAPLAKALETNKSIARFEVYLKARNPDFFAEDDDNISLHSVGHSTVVSNSERIALLGNNTSVAQFKVYGYIDVHAATVFGGLSTN